MSEVDRQQVSTADAARILSVSRRTIFPLSRSTSDFPAAVIKDEVALWPRAEIERWGANHPDRRHSYRPPARCSPGDTPGRIDKMLWSARELAQELNHTWIGVEHLLVAVLGPDVSGEAPRVLASLGVSYFTARRALVDAFGDPFDSAGADLNLTYTPRCRLTVERSNLIAYWLQDDVVDSEHLLLALVDAWDDAPILAKIVGQVKKADIVSRVVAITEGLDVEYVSVPPPQIPMIARTNGLQLRPTPDGSDPFLRKPWCSRHSTDEDVANGFPSQYLIDRDQHPILTVDGSFVDLAVGSDGQVLLDTNRRPVLVTVPAV